MSDKNSLKRPNAVHARLFCTNVKTRKFWEKTVDQITDQHTASNVPNLGKKDGLLLTVFHDIIYKNIFPTSASAFR